MLENRAFDHMFAFLRHPSLPRLVPRDHVNRLVPGDPNSQGYEPNDDAEYSLPVDPPHSHLSVMKQFNGRRPPKMDGFVVAYLEKARGEEVIPIIQWGRIEALVLVVAVVVTLLSRWLGPRWIMAAGLSVALAVVGTLVLLRMRRYIPNLRNAAGFVLLGCAALAVLAHLVGGHWATSVGFGVVVAVAGTVLVYRYRSRPLYAHPMTPEEALRDAPLVMRCMADDMIPVLGMLAREFAVCTRWHCSVPGETWPNRNFAHAATSGGTTDIEIGFYESRTVFELLQESGKSWHVYHDGMAQLMAFPRVWEAGADRCFAFSLFEHHVATDRLPHYSFIEPNHMGPRSNSQHPGNNLRAHDGVYDFERGEALIARIYEALRTTPAVFDKTLFLITYDEHGGLFDHDPPPTKAVAPTIRKAIVSWSRRFIAFFVTYRDDRFDFHTLGPRVPAVVVSPWIDGGTVDDTLYDHSSIVATVRALFAPASRPLTRRDKKANTLHHLAERRREPRPADQLPDLSRYVHPRPGPAPTSRQGLPGAQDTLAIQLGRLAEKMTTRLDELGVAAAPSADVDGGLAVDEEIYPHADVVRRFRTLSEDRRARDDAGD